MAINNNRLYALVLSKFSGMLYGSSLTMLQESNDISVKENFNAQH